MARQAIATDPEPAMKKILLPSLLLAAAGAAFAQSAAQVTATSPWARPTVQGQRSAGVYVTLTAAEPLTLVAISTPVAGSGEMHEMKLEGDVMRMRALERLDLPAGKPVALKPGGYHLMLQGLKAPLQPGTSIPVTLTFRTARGEQRELALQVPVSATPPKEADAAGHGNHKH
jgi:copper(I)-binding protein